MLARAMIGLLMFGHSALAADGGWTSGGGELLATDTNPWFVQSAQRERVVRYCIVADEANFGVEKRHLSRQVRHSFDYWRDEFSSAMIVNDVYVASETFVEQDCNGTESLRFQFGWLDADQERQFREHGQDPRRFVAVAVRTDYDEERLEGKGFIYVSPPRGPLGMTSSDVIAEPWQAHGQALLGAVLKHELGHVFGLQHNGGINDLMSGGFPELQINRNENNYGFFRGVFRIPQGVPIFTSFYGVGMFPDRLRRFLGIGTESFTILKYLVFGDRVRVVGQAEYNGPETFVGEIKIEAEKTWKVEPLIRLWLPERQRVFPVRPSGGQSFLVGPTAVHKQARGIYTGRSGSGPRQIHLHIAPNYFQVGGVLDDQLILDVNDAFENVPESKK